MAQGVTEPPLPQRPTRSKVKLFPS